MKINTIFVIPKLNETEENKNRMVESIKDILRYDKNINHITENTEVDSNTLIIAIGGDGTMLEALKLSVKTGAYCMGVNMGKVGFLTDFTIDNLHNGLSHVLDTLTSEDSIYKSEERIAIQLEWTNTVNDNIAMNEFVISNSDGDGVIEYKLKIGNHNAGVHRATSLIVSTPTGSTAYSLSAGGALLFPTLKVLQIVPVAPLSLSSRPIITHADETIEVEILGNQKLKVRSDGQQILEISESENSYTRVFKFRQYVGASAKLIHAFQWNFFDMLRSKLRWQNKS